MSLISEGNPLMVVVYLYVTNSTPRERPSAGTPIKGSGISGEGEHFSDSTGII
jgi:hypothetical protein